MIDHFLIVRSPDLKSGASILSQSQGGTMKKLKQNNAYYIQHTSEPP